MRGSFGPNLAAPLRVTRYCLSLGRYLTRLLASPPDLHGRERLSMRVQHVQFCMCDIDPIKPALLRSKSIAGLNMCAP